MADERDEQPQDEPEYVTLVDRTGGPGEFWFNGRPWTFTAAKPTRVVPQHIAIWLLGRQKGHVWTTDGAYTPRYTIKDGPSELITELGEEAFETSPIAIDATRAEGWDTSTVDRPDTRTITLSRRPSDFVNQGVGPSTFSGKER